MSSILHILNGRARARVFLGGLIALGAGAPHVRGQHTAIPASQGQNAPQPEKKEPEAAAQIELLETRVRFEVNGDSRKEVHTIVHINNELGAREFARISFDYNRSFQQIEFPLLRITHAGGGTAEILPSAVTDQPNPAVVSAPAYQDVRVKSVRLLGLAPGDTVEYRVITTTTKHPLAPDFWLDHTFDRSGTVQEEIFDLDLPTSRDASIRIDPAFAVEPTANSADGSSWRRYHWDHRASSSDDHRAAVTSEPDVALTTFSSWDVFSSRIFSLMHANYALDATVFAKAAALRREAHNEEDPRRALYDFVSQKITTIDLPLGSTSFRTRSPAEIIRSGYANVEDKCVLLAALTGTTRQIAKLALVQSRAAPEAAGLPRPSVFEQVLAVCLPGNRDGFWMDPGVGVAPYGMLRSTLRGRPALLLDSSQLWTRTSTDLPFAASQSVTIEANLALDGRLGAKVRYKMRGDNELTLRLAFHQSPRDKWPEMAQLLALADGFRGKITRVTASDPYATKEPFSVEYEIAQPKFVDWAKKPVRIPALLPQIGLPDAPSHAPNGSTSGTIELGTPLAIETHLTLHLPPGTTAQSPTGTAVVRDYAKFDSKYAATGQTVTAERQLSFLERSIPADRAADYNAFLRAVQNDEAQEFTLQRSEEDAAADPKASTAAPKPPK